MVTWFAASLSQLASGRYDQVHRFSLNSATGHLPLREGDLTRGVACASDDYFVGVVGIKPGGGCSYGIGAWVKLKGRVTRDGSVAEGKSETSARNRRGKRAALQGEKRGGLRGDDGCKIIRLRECTRNLIRRQHGKIEGSGLSGGAADGSGGGIERQAVRQSACNQ